MIDLVAEQAPLGGLERWLRDPSVDEVIVNAGSEVWIERDGAITHAGRMRPATVLASIEHILTPIGRRLDRAHPMVDARLPDGSRVCAVLPPIAVDGPCLTIRRFRDRSIGLQHFAPPALTPLLREIVQRRCNFVVSGATSSGKTTLLNTMALEIEARERVITLEDTAELHLPHPHVVRLETREATPDGVGEVTLAQLVRTALRLRPDRLVVGEVRGDETVHLLQALNTGHDGSMATVHANSATDALARLSSLVLQYVGNWPLAAVQHHVARAVDVVVHVERDRQGARHVVEVVEVAAAIAADPTSSGIATRQLADATTVLGQLRRTRR